MSKRITLQILDVYELSDDQCVIMRNGKVVFEFQQNVFEAGCNGCQLQWINASHNCLECPCSTEHRNDSKNGRWVAA